MNFYDYKKKKKKQIKDDETKREREEKAALAKSTPHFKEFIENIGEIIKDDTLTCKEECKCGKRTVTIYKAGTYWMSISHTYNHRPLLNEVFGMIEYDIKTNKREYKYFSQLSEWTLWHSFPIETCEDARLFIDYIVENIKPHKHEA